MAAGIFVVRALVDAEGATAPDYLVYVSTYIWLPLGILAFLASLAVIAICGKWVLSGRFRPSSHVFGGWWFWTHNNTARVYYDFHRMAGAFVRGTEYWNWVMRALGARVGNNVIMDAPWCVWARELCC